MNIRMPHILCFVFGIIIVIGVLWVIEQKKNTGFNGQSNVSKLIYRDIENNKTLINSNNTVGVRLGDYVGKIDKAVSVLNGIALPANIDTSSDGDVLRITNMVYSSLEQSRMSIYRSYKVQSQNDNNIESELDNSFTNIDNQFFASMQPFYQYVRRDSVNRIDKGIRSEINHILKDSIGGFAGRRTAIVNVMVTEKNRLTLLQKKMDDSIAELNKKNEELESSLGDLEKSSKDRLLMMVVLPTFAIIVILLFVVPYIYRNNDNIVSRLFEDKIILQVFTVFILVVAILLLGIGDKIKGETLGTLLGGISVYVLQNALGQQPNGRQDGNNNGGNT